MIMYMGWKKLRASLDVIGSDPDDVAGLVESLGKYFIDLGFDYSTGQEGPVLKTVYSEPGGQRIELTEKPEPGPETPSTLEYEWTFCCDDKEADRHIAELKKRCEMLGFDVEG